MEAKTKETTHTPTPWIPWETPMIHQGKYFQCPVESAHHDGIINVAIVFGVTIEECKANARIIADAPALSERVRELEAIEKSLRDKITEIEREQRSMSHKAENIYLLNKELVAALKLGTNYTSELLSVYGDGSETSKEIITEIESNLKSMRSVLSKARKEQP